MCVLRRLRTECFNKLEVLGRVHQVILAADHVAHFHFKVIDDVHEMEHVGTVAAPDDHVGRVRGIAVINGDFTADEIVHGDRLTIKAEAVGIAVLVEAVSSEEFFEIGIVDLVALGLVVGAE